MADAHEEARDPRATDSSTHWETVWASKGRESVSWYEESPDTSTALVLSDGVPRTVIDVGAGASLLPDALLDAGVDHVTLLDLSMSALALTSVRLDERANRVTTIVGDVLTADLDEQYDVWHDRAVFHFLVEPEQRAAYAAQVRRALAPGGLLVVGTFAEDGPEQCSGLPVARYDADALVAELGGSDGDIHPRRDPSGRAPHALGRRAAVHLGGAASRVTRIRDGAGGSGRVLAARPAIPGEHFRAVAQLGSALDWGSRGRRFKSCQPDQRFRRSEAVLREGGGLCAFFRPPSDSSFDSSSWPRAERGHCLGPVAEPPLAPRQVGLGGVARPAQRGQVADRVPAAPRQRDEVLHADMVGRTARHAWAGEQPPRVTMRRCQTSSVRDRWAG